MESRATCLFRVLPLYCVLLTGCVYSTANVKLHYAPDQERKSPLSTLKPMKVSLQVEDQRQVGNPNQLGNRKGGFGNIGAPVLSEKKSSLVVFEALKTEFENNGHTVDGSPDASSPGVAVNIKLTKYWADHVIHFFDVEMVGTITSDVVIRKAAPNEVLAEKPLSATFRESRQLVTEDAFDTVLNGALAEFVRSFSRDPKILEAFRVFQNQKEGS